MNIIIKKRNIKDHKARWLTISIAGIYFIWLKIKGWGIPQNVEAKEVKKIPFKRLFFFNVKMD